MAHYFDNLLGKKKNILLTKLTIKTLFNFCLKKLLVEEKKNLQLKRKIKNKKGRRKKKVDMPMSSRAGRIEVEFVTSFVR